MTLNVFADNVVLQRLAEEPTIRIGLTTNASSVAISTNDSQLTSISPNESNRFLATNKINVTARAYRPPEITVYSIEIAGITTQSEAEQTAKDLRESLQENAVTLLDATTNAWKIKVGDEIETLDEANALKERVGEQGFEDAFIVTKTVKQPSNDAVALSQAKSGSSVSNLILSRPTNSNSDDVNLVNPTVLSNPAIVAPEIVQPEINSNLREVIVKGASFASSFSSLKPVAFGSTNERNVPVRVNGKSYRGRIEVFVNERGNLTVVNVVKIEDYLRGVVPNELGLPSLEAQKAQAVAARTYAIKNMGQFGKEGFDILPTTRSQVYRGFSSENSTATLAVEQTKGIVATYNGKPINAMYTSTCGGRTENVENIYEFAEPYLRGVECSLEGREHFQTLLVKSNRELPKIERDENIRLTRDTAFLAVNNWQISTNRFSDDYFSDAPNENELRAWLNAIASRLNQPFPQNVTTETGKPANLANLLATMLYGADYADTLLSASDVNYQLSFADGDKVPVLSRANTAVLLRDGWFSLYSDATLRPD
ncbi:MAG: SpoIID/LytB domain-containing protein, partial [Pyrinomonadaceae bacterium]|nr:SpoIID/LytB domain-containing protein [Pyrinomonadaceae bacterium]